MTAPDVALVSVTVRVVVYVPAPGLNVTGETAPLVIVYAALAVALAVQPALNARASSVALASTTTGPAYSGDRQVGSLPSSV